MRAEESNRLGDRVHAIRIVLMNLRPRLRDIIADAVTNECDMDLVAAELQSERDLERVGADVLIVGTTEPNDDEVPSRLLSIAPRMSVLMIAMSGDAAVLYQLRPQKKPLGQVNAAGLVTAIRLGAGREAVAS